ncbi:MAG: GerMN domain-containing protein [Pyrinomonadaceae bacterium]
MTIFNQRIPLLTFIALLTALFAALHAAGQTADLKKVTVYFWEFNREGGGDDLIPFTRMVNKKAPLGPAIEALLAGPTVAENRKRFGSVAYGDIRLSSIQITGGTARIDFTRVVREDNNPGDLQTLRFEAAVIRTAKQFPEIKNVIVCVNGMNEFGIGMVIDAPLPCKQL